ncbi:uncharacterized protein LOC115616258 [Strigops habroptila]|uniref:uncharacterized protein LOC115616258 n=1 Tax=Strigops habroptila TaxID=2489341 RepID=UPI0011CF1FDB|nr:uncharacterized protein LOC115616258 [Strigops habroptila]XP_030361137.1 uncharacterized protein LOC115616258 [Strigops habroptila]
MPLGLKRFQRWVEGADPYYLFGRGVGGGGWKEGGKGGREGERRAEKEVASWGRNPALGYGRRKFPLAGVAQGALERSRCRMESLLCVCVCVYVCLCVCTVLGDPPLPGKRVFPPGFPRQPRPRSGCQELVTALRRPPAALRHRLRAAPRCYRGRSGPRLQPPPQPRLFIIIIIIIITAAAALVGARREEAKGLRRNLGPFPFFPLFFFFFSLIYSLKKKKREKKKKKEDVLKMQAACPAAHTHPRLPPPACAHRTLALARSTALARVSKPGGHPAWCGHCPWPFPCPEPAWGPPLPTTNTPPPLLLPPPHRRAFPPCSWR